MANEAVPGAGGGSVPAGGGGAPGPGPAGGGPKGDVVYFDNERPIGAGGSVLPGAPAGGAPAAAKPAAPAAPAQPEFVSIGGVQFPGKRENGVLVIDEAALDRAYVPRPVFHRQLDEQREQFRRQPAAAPKPEEEEDPELQPPTLEDFEGDPQTDPTGFRLHQIEQREKVRDHELMLARRENAMLREHGETSATEAKNAEKVQTYVSDFAKAWKKLGMGDPDTNPALASIFKRAEWTLIRRPDHALLVGPEKGRTTEQLLSEYLGELTLYKNIELNKAHGEAADLSQRTTIGGGSGAADVAPPLAAGESASDLIDASLPAQEALRRAVEKGALRFAPRG